MRNPPSGAMVEIVVETAGNGQLSYKGVANLATLEWREPLYDITVVESNDRWLTVPTTYRLIWRQSEAQKMYWLREDPNER